MHGGSKFSETMSSYADAWRKKLNQKRKRATVKQAFL
jgi:hypothetical protein